ncbi:MAG: IS256 family transposase, partial [Sediminibacterium sp.]|nr:IS256 family transposase [Sediminibacterium sp.]
MQEKKQDFDYEAIKRKTLEQIRSGRSLFGKDGAFAPMLKDILESALEAEFDHYLDTGKRVNNNRKNGYTKKRLRTSDGTIELETPRDRTSQFEPEIVRKRETILAESLESKIISLYGMGMSLRDMSSHIKDMYDTEVSHDTLSNIIDKVIPIVKEWQNRSLEPVYTIVFLDAMYYKVKEEGRYVTRCMYNLLGIKVDGCKEILGCYFGEIEGANFWLQVLNDLKRRGVEDILIACIDNLKGFSEAILGIFPKTEIQSCIVHQIRNSLKFVSSKDQKEFMKDLKEVYRANNEDQGMYALDKLEIKWGKKYPIVIDSWRKNWGKLSTFFKYPEGIRRLIYTTNAIEGYHRQIRKVTKTKGGFTSDIALLKLVYLATMNIQKKWTMPMKNWSLILTQL